MAKKITEVDVAEQLSNSDSIFVNQDGALKQIPKESLTGLPGTVTDEQVAKWNAAEVSGTAETKVSKHNTDTVAHNDIRLLVQELTTRLNALANSDDTTLDQMAEVVAYIKSNRTLIESVTTGKVNVTDIVNNLTTNVANKPLSAAQGVTLKGMIDALQGEIADHVKTVNGKTAENGEVTVRGEDILTILEVLDPETMEPIETLEEMTVKFALDLLFSTLDEMNGVIYNSIPSDSISQDIDKDKKQSNHVPSTRATYNFVTGLLAGITAPTKTSELSNDSEYVSKNQLTLAYGTDGKLYLNVGGEPIGNGIEIGVSGDVVGVVDENNNIVLSGNLADGKYTLKYENEDGTVTEVGSFDVGEILAYTNLFNPSTATLNKGFSSTSASTGYLKDRTGHVFSDYIPFPNGALTIPLIENKNTDHIIRIKNAQWAEKAAIAYCKQDGSFVMGEFDGYVYYEHYAGEGADANGDMQLALCSKYASGTAHGFRIALYKKSTAVTADDIKDIIVTFDEPIAD